MNKASFLFIQCWLLVKDITRWSRSMEVKTTPITKCKFTIPSKMIKDIEKARK